MKLEPQTSQVSCLFDPLFVAPLSFVGSNVAAVFVILFCFSKRHILVFGDALLCWLPSEFWSSVALVFASCRSLASLSVR